MNNQYFTFSPRSLCIGIGEIIIDDHGDVRLPGGAPLNFAYYCNKLGAEADILSSVGQDLDGQYLLSYIENIGLSTEYISIHARLPTGLVSVSVDNLGEPTFHIHENRAWDEMQVTQPMVDISQKADAICFGTLSQRNRISRESIRSILRDCNENCIRVFDINLRQDHYTNKDILFSLKHSEIIKLNTAELEVLKSILNLCGNIHEQLGQIQSEFDLQIVLLTQGALGCTICTTTTFIEVPGCDTTVVDTIGAGDAFIAGFTYGYINGATIESCAKAGNRLASEICSGAGSLPDTTDQDIFETIRAVYETN